MNATTLAVYAGTYHKYNCGSIFGEWFDLTDFDSEADFYAACCELHADEAEPEMMFQDIEGIPDAFASESSINWGFVEAYRQAADAGNADAFIAWAENTGGCDYAVFEDAYCGEAPDEEEYARKLAEEYGILNDVPEALRGYFDFAAYARDLFYDGYVFCGGYIFRE